MYDQVDVIQNSIKDKFGIEKEAPAKEQGANVALLNSLKKSRLDLQSKYLDLQSKNEHLRDELRDLKSKLEDANQSLAESKQELENADRSFNSRDKQNAPEPNEPIADLRSDGLGGRGTKKSSHGSRGPFHVKVTLPDGSVLEEDAHVGKNGVMLSSSPDATPRSQLSVEITHGDQTIHVQARAVMDDNGQVSNRLKFLRFDGNDQATFNAWLKDR
jgi:hypothetical protein